MTIQSGFATGQSIIYVKILLIHFVKLYSLDVFFCKCSFNVFNFLYIYIFFLNTVRCYLVPVLGFIYRYSKRDVK